MSMRQRKVRRAVVIEYGRTGIPQIRGGKHIVLSVEDNGHDDHNSWDLMLVLRFKKG